MAQRRNWIILGVLIAIVSVVHVLWLLKDEVPMPSGDSYAYLSKLFQFIDGFSAEQRPNLSHSFTRLSLLGRPPLYQFSTLPFVLIFGRSEDAALLTNIVFLAILAIATYNIGRLAKNHHAGLLAAFMVLTYAPVIRLSRLYMPHFATYALGALSLWLLLSLVDRRSIKTAWFLGLSLAAGLLNHPFFAFILIVPTIVTGIYLLLFQTEPRRPSSLRRLPAWGAAKCRDRFVLLGLLPAALIAIGPALLWYMIWGGPGLNQLEQVGSAVPRGMGFPQIRPTFWWYALTTPGVISNVFTLFLVVGLIVAVIKRQTKTLILLLALLAAYPIYIMLLPLRVWWHFGAVLPIVAVLSVVWIFDSRRKWLATSLIPVILLVGSFNFFLVTWGGNQAWAVPIARVLGAPLSDKRTCNHLRANHRRFMAFCPDNVRSQPWPWDEIAAALHAEPACQTDQPCWVLFAGSMAQASLIIQYTLVRDKITNIYTRNLTRIIPYDFEAMLYSDFVMYPDTGPAAGFFSGTIEFLRTSPPEFADAHQTVGTFTVPESAHSTLTLIKRVEPVSLEEVEASIAQIDLPEQFEYQTFAALSRAYGVEGDPERAMEFYRKVQEEDSTPFIRRMQLTTRAFLIKEFVALAETYRSQGNKDQAISTYEKVLQLYPNNAAVRSALQQLKAQK